MTHSENQKKYCQTHYEQVMAYKKLYRETHKSENIIRAKNYRDENKELIKEKARRNQKNITAYHKKYQAARKVEKTITCKACANEFMQTNGNQKNCKTCRDLGKNGIARVKRIRTRKEKNCAVCGEKSGNKKYCSAECRLKKRRETKAEGKPCLRTVEVKLEQRVSKIDDIERQARESNMHYRDIQMAKTLSMAGRVEI